MPIASRSERMEEFKRRVVELVPHGECIIGDAAALSSYGSDGLIRFRQTPEVVVLAKSAGEIHSAVKLCAELGIPFVGRGSGTGLSGGAVPPPDGVVIAASAMKGILEIDPVDRIAVVEPGVANLVVSERTAPFGLYYAPDPSSQSVCSIGGNVAENSGGAHCLKYGFTTNHVLAIEVVLPDGSVEVLGGESPFEPGLDLRSSFLGSEGTLGIVTKVWLRLLSRPEAVRTLVADFDSAESAGAAVSAIIAAGIVPAAIEMMDALAIEACEKAVGAGYSLDAAAALIVEVDGPREEVDALYEEVKSACVSCGTTKIREAADQAERSRIWLGRKAAFAAAGRLAPAYIVQDGVVPRTALASILGRIAELADEAGLRVANVFHAGDGNLHPLVLYNPDSPEESEAAERVASEIVELCVEIGGSITGEHGVGLEKACSMAAMFDSGDLEAMQRLRIAFDAQGIANPGKVFPTPRLCGDTPGRYRAHPLELSGEAIRF